MYKRFNLSTIMFGLLGLYLFSVLAHVTPLRALVGVTVVTFFPGVLLFIFLSKRQVTDKDFCESVLYIIGLSLSFWMFFGFLMNYMLLYFSIKIFTESVLPLNVIVILTTLLLVNLKYIKNCTFTINSLLEKLLDIQSLSTLYVFILSVLGIYIINFYGNNIIALFSIIAIVVIPIAVVFDKISGRNLAFAIWIVSLSLLYLNTLFGSYFRATDNICEYYFSNLILKNGYWMSIPAGLNAMLGVTILVPTYSLVCSVSLNWVFKFIAPFIASFIPVGLYISFKRIMNEKLSFLSSFFYISMYEYYTWSGLTMKMVTAGLYMTLLIMILTDRKFNNFIKNIFLVIFGFSLAVSHYGTSYIFMFCLVGAYIVNRFFIYFCRYNKGILLSKTFIILYIVFAIYWYIYISMSSLYINLTSIGNHIIYSIINKFILSKRSYVCQVFEGHIPAYLQILGILYYIATVMIVIGIVSYVIQIVFGQKLKLNILDKVKIGSEYLSFSVLYCVAGSTVFLGGLSGIATPDRIFQIISFFLAPFCIIGGVMILEVIRCIAKIRKKIDSLKLISIFLIIFFLFNSCFAAEVLWKYNVGPMVSISGPRIIKNGTLNEREYINRVYMFRVNMIGVEWLKVCMANYSVFCSANFRKYMVVAKITELAWKQGLASVNIYTLTNRTDIPVRSYIYLGRFNIETGKMKIGGSITPIFVNVSDNPGVKLCCRVYSNGRCQILYY